MCAAEDFHTAAGSRPPARAARRKVTGCLAELFSALQMRFINNTNTKLIDNDNNNNNDNDNNHDNKDSDINNTHHKHDDKAPLGGEEGPGGCPRGERAAARHAAPAVAG